MEVKLFKGDMLLNSNNNGGMNYNSVNEKSIDKIGKLITFRANFTKLIAPLIKMDETKNIDLISEADRIVNDVVVPIYNSQSNYNYIDDGRIIEVINDLLFMELYRLGLRCSLYKTDDTKVVNYINSIKSELYNLCNQLI